MNVLNKESTLPAWLEYFGVCQEHVGSNVWWQSVSSAGVPFIHEESEQTSSVLFVWQDPQGNEYESSIASVLLDVNSLTDHHSWEPVCLHRISGTDVWLGELQVYSSWRGSYSFIPIEKHQLPDSVRQTGDGSREAQRAWWMSVAVNQISDPLNPLPELVSGWGVSSPLHLPKATTELGWQEWDRGELNAISASRVNSINWSSKELGNQRTAWLFSTVTSDAPLVILLDGQKWGAPSGTLSVLQYLTDTSKIAPAHYLLVPSIDGPTRWKELSCHHPFWQSLLDELLPIVTSILAKDDCSATDFLVAGQSLGGLSALYAGVTFPEYFSKVISLSGSFWWPEDSRMRAPNNTTSSDEWIKNVPANSLADQILKNQISVSHLHVFLNVGSGEADMCLYNEATYRAIQQKGGQVHYEMVCGGHDWLSWRSGLIDGLRYLMPARS